MFVSILTVPSVSHLIAAIYAGGYEPSTQAVAWFWEAMRTYSHEQRGTVLRFVTGTSKYPLDGFEPKFNITRASDGNENSLPHAHTCFNQLVLPEYTTFNKLKEKVIYAAANTVGFGLT